MGVAFAGVDVNLSENSLLGPGSSYGAAPKTRVSARRSRIRSNFALLGDMGAFIYRHFTENCVEVGFSYKFETAAPAPVVAKY